MTEGLAKLLAEPLAYCVLRLLFILNTVLLTLIVRAETSLPGSHCWKIERLSISQWLQDAVSLFACRHAAIFLSVFPRPNCLFKAADFEKVPLKSILSTTLFYIGIVQTLQHQPPPPTWGLSGAPLRGKHPLIEIYLIRELRSQNKTKKTQQYLFIFSGRLCRP